MTRKDVILEHRFSGDVVYTGNNVTEVGVRDRVTVYPIISCRRCNYCVSGKRN